MTAALGRFTTHIPALARSMSTRPHRLLSVDGGGIRGIIPAKVMIKMEEYTGKPLHQLFDGMAGTSTGGILALSASAPDKAGSKINRFSAKEILGVYTEPGMAKLIYTSAPKNNDFQKSQKAPPGFNLFSFSFDFNRPMTYDSDLPFVRPLVRTQYTAKNLEGVLQQRFADLKLSDLLTDVLITSLEISSRTPHVFTRAKALNNASENHLVWKVARMTSAAPTYFDPYILNGKQMVDGGLVANNPTTCALVDALSRGIALKDIVCVSLGTGEYITPMNVQGIGLLHIAQKIFDTVSLSTSILSDQHARALLGKSYHRFQAKLSRDIDLDSVSPSVIAELEEIGARLVQERKDEIERACDKLQTIEGPYRH